MKRRTFAVCFVFLSYLLAASLRLYDIVETPPQPDELHWRARSYTVVKKLTSGEYARATSHLGHPGAPPAAIMGASQFFFDRLNARRGFEPGSRGAIDHLAASRIANAAVSSLVVPLVFLGSCSIVGYGAAALAALLLALDPHHIGLSREAHLDTMLTLFVTASVLLFYWAVRRDRPGLKLLAGVFWGFAILTKPTAGALVLVFLIYKLFRYLYRRAGASIRGETAVVSWSDVAAVCIGQAMLGAGFTRLWYHDSEYLHRLAIKSKLADWLYGTGRSLQAFPFSAWIFSLLTALALFFRVSTGKKRPNAATKIVLSGVVLLAVFTLALALVPQVLENLVRFWYWTAGLSKVAHRGYGVTWRPPAGGYLELYATKLPIFALVGIAAALWGCAASLLKRRGGRKGEAAAAQILCLLTVVLWTAPLSFSSKQTLRYVMPVIPFVYLLAAIGLRQLLRAIQKQARRLGMPVRMPLAGGCLCVVTLLQAHSVYRWAPDFLLYHNALGGSPKAALMQQHSLPLAGVDRALHFLNEQPPFGVMEETVVALVGDLRLLRVTAARLLKENNRLRFVPANGSYDPDYLLLFEHFRHTLLPEALSHWAEGEPAFRYAREGAPLLSVYAVEARDFDTPKYFDLSRSLHSTGRSVTLEGPLAERLPPEATDPQALIASPGIERRDYLFFGRQPKLLAGEYRAQFWVALPEPAAELPDNTPVLRVELGKRERIIYRGELSHEEFRAFELARPVDESKRMPIRGYWYGKAPVAVAGVTLARERPPAAE